MAVSSQLLEHVRQLWGTSLPNGWKFMRFGDALARVERPVQISDDEFYKQPVIRRNHGGVGVREVQRGGDIMTKKQYAIRAGDWLMSKVQIMHRAYGIVPPELDGAIASGSYYSFVSKGPIDLGFLWYLSQLAPFHRTCDLASVGVVIEKMVFRVEDWCEFEFPCPPLAEQRKIAAILSSMDEVIEATQEVVQQLRSMKEATTAVLVSRGVPGLHGEFQATPLGDLPASWRVVRVSDIAALGGGSTPSRSRPDFFTKEGGTPWVKTMDLNDGVLERTDEQVTATALREVRLRVYPKGTLLVAMYGGFQQIGRTALLGVPCATNQALCPIEVSRRDVEPRFLNLWFVANKPRWRKIAASSRKDPNVTKQDVASFLVALPPLIEQRRIADLVDAFDARLSAECDVIAAAKCTRAGLLSTMLTGKISLRPPLKTA